jgi:hypothetical protein
MVLSQITEQDLSARQLRTVSPERGINLATSICSVVHFNFGSDFLLRHTLFRNGFRQTFLFISSAADNTDIQMLFLPVVTVDVEIGLQRLERATIMTAFQDDL